MTFSRRAIAGSAALAIALSVFPARVATAEPASDLVAAQERLGSLGSELGSLEDELSTLTADLERTDNEMWRTQESIKDTEQRLDEARTVLAARMRSGYKSGGFNFIEFLFSSSSFEDLSSRLYYMDKIVGRDEAVIADVRTLENELEDELGQLQAQHDDQQARIDVVKAHVGEYNQLVGEARAYYEQLDAQVRQQLEAEAAAAQQQNNDSVSTAVNAISEQQTSESVTGATEAVVAAEEQIGTQQPADPVVTEPVQEEQEEQTEPEPEPEDEEPQSEPEQQAEPEPEDEEQSEPEEYQTGGDCYPGGGVASAYSCIGWPYVWGGFGPSMGGFDCSGLVSYCYGDGSWRAGAEPLGLAIQAAGLWKDGMDNLSYGDLVFTDSEFNHVGIYIGDGMMIHAPTFGRTVSIDYVWSCYGGGPFVYPY